MRIHVLGICGTFMGGVALLAKQAGHEVSGSDLNVYPPMSTQLAAQGIKLFDGWNPANIDAQTDYVIVGNVISRGNPLMEYILDQNITYISGPQWLAENVLKDRWVLAVSGTHGKTTTTSLLSWILDYSGLNPGFLVGGVPQNFGVSARLSDKPFFVIEADEYDSAYFDKRSKFIHYHPKTLIMNNLEFDHADIFADLAAIKQQFHHLVRTVPGNGMIIKNHADKNLTDVLEKGCWSRVSTFGTGNWQAKLHNADGSSFDVYQDGQRQGTAEWNLLGLHNVDNALAAVAAAQHAGVAPAIAIEALRSFKSVKRRLEIKGSINGITLYDDFAHHPTAISTTLQGLRARVGQDARIIAVLEFGSYTMRTGVHRDHIKNALSAANIVFGKRPAGEDWGLTKIFKQLPKGSALFDSVGELVDTLIEQIEPNDNVIVMSNSGFEGIHEKILESLREEA